MTLLQTTNTTTNVPKHPKFHLPSLWKDLESRGETPELQITSLPSLDRKIWGLKKGELLTLASRTSQGKTTMAMQWAWDLATQGKSVVVFSLEMTVNALLERLFCHVEEIDNQQLLIGKFAQYQEKRARFEEKIKEVPLLITEGLGNKWSEVHKFISMIQPKPDCIILDHLGCISGGRVDRKIVNDYIYKLRAEAVKNNIAIVLLNQINRSSVTSQDNKDKRPSLEGLKESGSIEELSDKVVLLHHPFFYNQTLDREDYQIFIAKNRNGRVGHFKCKFDARYYKFRDLFREVVSPDGEIKEVVGIFKGKVLGKE